MIDAIKSIQRTKTTTRKSRSNYEHALASFALCMHAAAIFRAQSTAFYLENVQLNCTK